MRSVNGDTRSMNSALETINAAATAIASAENRVPQPTVQELASLYNFKRFAFLGMEQKEEYRIFRSPKDKRIGHAVLAPESRAPGSGVPAAENLTQAPTIVLPFVAPPSSPASFLQSEPPSATQSPSGLLSLTSINANIYSPGGPASIFAIGPYAHETQLVSPPVFSTFTTEPSTAPFTPPPESVHLTTPSSPEVPFAQLFDPNNRNGEAGHRFLLSQYEFQSYQLYPGSPVGHLISPSSGISGSGTSSPFPDLGITDRFWFNHPDALGPPSRDGSVLDRQVSDVIHPPSGDDSVLDRQISDVASHSLSDSGCPNNEIMVDHRVSFELTAEDVVRCVEKDSAALVKAVSASLQNPATVEIDENSREVVVDSEGRVGETANNPPEKAPEDANGEEGQPHHKQRSITLGSAKEFNFDNADGGHSDKPNISSDWWANEKVVGKEVGASKNWSIFHMMQPSVS
ncbi:Uncharacterized protein CK203_067687 [Vitis vinifera]|uniref:Hydroxyproline-rich glycoprotein family protein n=1 Tax=Vitis vinifera TaxID=29760 RepID=A0A438BZR6_VITVI|nr:Uncharacterized protein CK203_067687 [Vitis vinifera]